MLLTKVLHMEKKASEEKISTKKANLTDSQHASSWLAWHYMYFYLIMKYNYNISIDQS